MENVALVLMIVIIHVICVFKAYTMIKLIKESMIALT